ncbi:MAG: TonB-dependent receptor plug domain-containing protein [Saprospiraceae bacterium]|nr:TonB-dependent receptor plug domain-containing protein [Saprospiraceae bacterium]
MGYATTTIDAGDVAAKPETDIARAIAGRAPGIVTAQSSGLAGSTTKVNIRGISSISGNTQPLYIVDGVPINSDATNSGNQDFRDGLISPARSLDIDPNNIESMNILRGLSAATLYGSAGRNGVILITTKSGSQKKENVMRQLLINLISLIKLLFQSSKTFGLMVCTVDYWRVL